MVLFMVIMMVPVLMMMKEIDEKFPIYEFAKHKGYGTKKHFSKLYKYGSCREHRQSFAPMRDLNK